jgi:hypothetical protein
MLLLVKAIPCIVVDGILIHDGTGEELNPLWVAPLTWCQASVDCIDIW